MTARDVLVQSADELRRKVEAHQCLLASAMEGGGVRPVVNACFLLDCPHKRKLKETLADAIVVLEESRKAFKSRQLEALRKKLIGVLAEDA